MLDARLETGCPHLLYRKRSASRASSVNRSHNCVSSELSAPSATAVATSSAAHRTSNIRSTSSTASTAVKMTASAGIDVPLTALRCSYARCRQDWLQYRRRRPTPVTATSRPHHTHGFPERADCGDPTRVLSAMNRHCTRNSDAFDERARYPVRWRGCVFSPHGNQSGARGVVDECERLLPKSGRPPAVTNEERTPPWQIAYFEVADSEL